MREITVGIHAELALGEIVDDLDLSRAARERAAKLGLARRASNLIAWANDVYTYEKEIQIGDPNNLVTVLAEGEGEGKGSTSAPRSAAPWRCTTPRRGSSTDSPAILRCSAAIRSSAATPACCARGPRLGA